MKKIILGALLILANSASADPWDSRIYVTGTVGISSIPQVELASRNLPTTGELETDGINATVGLGVGIAQKYVRNELRIDYHGGYVDQVRNGVELKLEFDGSVAGSSLAIGTFMYALYVQYPFPSSVAALDEKIALYIGGGIGAAYGKIPFVGVDGEGLKDWAFAWQGTGGIYWEFVDRLGLDLGYRYVASTEFEDTSDVAASWSAHEGILSLRYTFGGD